MELSLAMCVHGAMLNALPANSISGMWLATVSKHLYLSQMLQTSAV
jgi:hypothetical protein